MKLEINRNTIAKARNVSIMFAAVLVLLFSIGVPSQAQETGRVVSAMPGFKAYCPVTYLMLDKVSLA